MDGNKDEALKCVRIAEDAVASGNKDRALKFIKMAKRLNPSLSADELLDACEKLDSVSKDSSPKERLKSVDGDRVKPGKLEKERNFTKENVQLIRHIKRNNDYYAILGVDKSCPVEEIRRAYRKLSLKVHPDKSKAPGSEEAFKKVSKAFTCLSDDNSRRQYDEVGLVDEFDHIQRQNHRPRRRRYTRTDSFEDDFDPDEIFRAFFGQRDMFRSSYAYRTRGTRNQPRAEETNWGGGASLLTFLQILPFLLIFLLAYLPFSEPEYSLHKNHAYQIPKSTQNIGINFYVRSSAFDEKFPLGSASRVNIEDSVIKDYKNFLFHSCRIELQKRRWNRNMPISHCNKLQEHGFVERIYG